MAWIPVLAVQLFLCACLHATTALARHQGAKGHNQPIGSNLHVDVTEIHQRHQLRVRRDEHIGGPRCKVETTQKYCSKYERGVKTTYEGKGAPETQSMDACMKACEDSPSCTGKPMVG